MLSKLYSLVYYLSRRLIRCKTLHLILKLNLFTSDSVRREAVYKNLQDESGHEKDDACLLISEPVLQSIPYQLDSRVLVSPSEMKSIMFAKPCRSPFTVPALSRLTQPSV
jgi:hypothetical protein